MRPKSQGGIHLRVHVVSAQIVSAQTVDMLAYADKFAN
jgi:hypothetical protein